MYDIWDASGNIARQQQGNARLIGPETQGNVLEANNANVMDEWSTENRSRVLQAEAERNRQHEKDLLMMKIQAEQEQRAMEDDRRRREESRYRGRSGSSEGGIRAMIQDGTNSHWEDVGDSYTLR
jgi:hypothetical protein